MSETRWQRICPVDRVPLDRGVAALAPGADGDQHMVAIFRLSAAGTDHPEQWWAIDHVDPVAMAPVMARGLVGSSGTIPTVASPIGKQRYDLRTGQTLDSGGPKLETWPVRVTNGYVEVEVAGS